MKIDEFDNVSGALSGNGNGRWAKLTLDGIGVTVKNFVSGEGIKKLIKNAGDALKKGWEFIKDWWAEDPVGLLAGGALLTLGCVVIATGGAAIGAIGGGIVGLIGAGLTALGIGNLVAPDLIRNGINWLIGKAYELYNFNWNITDAEIDAQAKALTNVVANVLGESLGEAIGNVVCGWLPGIAMVKLNPKTFAKLALATATGGEWLDNIRDAFNGFIAVSAQVGASIVAGKLYKNTRRMIKAAARGLPIPQQWKTAIDNWGKPGSEPWSFAIAVEEKIESIDNEAIRNFAEGLVEGLIDGCLDGAVALNYAW